MGDGHYDGLDLNTCEVGGAIRGAHRLGHIRWGGTMRGTMVI